MQSQRIKGQSTLFEAHTMSHNKKDTDAKNYAKEAAKRLFGNTTQEEDEALERVKTLGTPENLIKPDADDEPPTNSPKNLRPNK
jgi:hypothetical protein